MFEKSTAVSQNAHVIKLNVGADRFKNVVIRSAPFVLSKPTSINRVKHFAFDLVYVHYFVVFGYALNLA